MEAGASLRCVRRRRSHSSASAACRGLRAAVALLGLLGPQQADGQHPGDWGTAGGKGWSCTARAIEAECRPAADSAWVRNNPTDAGAAPANASDADPQADLLACVRNLCPDIGDAVDVCGAGDPVVAQIGMMFDGTEGWGYDSSLECAREIRVGDGQEMSLIFIEWRLHDTDDYVAVYDTASGHAIFSNGGRYMPPLHEVKVDSGQANVMFHTDAANTDRGWTAIWIGERLGCMQPDSPLFEADATGEPENGCLVPVCPGGAGAIDVTRYRRGELGIAPYQAGLSCGKPLGAAVGERIAISFTHWDMYDAGDMVKIYDGPDASAALLGTWVGSDAACHSGRRFCDNADAPWGGAVHVSSGASLFILFVSSAHGNGDGWAAEWRTLARCHTSSLGHGWSSTNHTLALVDDDTDPEPLLSASQGSVSAAVESEIFSRTCAMEGEVYAACLADGSWASVTADRLSNPPMRPTVCSPPLRRPPPPPPPVQRPPPPPGPSPPHVVLGGCPRGKYRAPGGRCVDCAVGYYQPSDGFRGSACTMCGPGRCKLTYTIRDLVISGISLTSCL